MSHFLLLSFFFFIFTLSLSLSYSDETVSDSLPLLAFKSSSDHSNSLASWSESTDPCSGSWLGVSCDPFTRRVTKLVLENLNLSGPIQPLTSLRQLRLLSLNRNRHSSSLNFSTWPHLKHLYLSHNNFSGQFPAAVSELRDLRRLDLSHNRLSGDIPLSKMSPKLLTLRLESNELTGFGDAPPKVAPLIADFNVSDNDIAGGIPQPLQRFGEASFYRNPRLCGKPLPNICPFPTAVRPPSVAPPSEASSHQKHLVLIGFGVALGALTLAGAVLRWRNCKIKSCRNSGGGGGGGYVGGGKKTKELKYGGSHRYNNNGPDGGPNLSEEELVVLEGCNPSVGKVGDLLNSSAELLGKGNVGSTYKITLNGWGETTVVKRLRRETKINGKDLAAWLGIVGQLKHDNIVKLKAYHVSKYEVLLVYDFFANGSLHCLLHGFRAPERTRLDWSKRLKLALGCAEGLAFVHASDKGKNKMYHGHFNSCNVLIDDNGNACVADIGLKQLVAPQASSYDAFTAPELIMPGGVGAKKYSRKCDVYSFGVVLMEILTGRMAGEEGGMSLVEWVNLEVKKECTSTWEVFDFELMSDKEKEEEMWALLHVGLLCVSPQLKDRPTMNTVRKMIEDITKKGVREDGTAASILDDISFPSTSSPSETTS